MWRWDQAEPFGNNPPNEDPDGDGVAFDFPMRFPGQYFDRETNLAYNYFRDYSAEVGRYVESDPIGLVGGANTYAYVSESPLTRVDRLGLLDLIYVNATHALVIIDGNGNFAGVFPAGNNAQSDSRGPIAAGTYDYAYHTTHPDDAPNSAFGTNGNYVYDVPGCVGCGVHSGRASSTDGAGRTGTQYATNGCVRTTDEATSLIQRLMHGGDLPRRLTVVR